MTLVNILQAAKEIKSSVLSISDQSENVAGFIYMNYILESVLEDGYSVIERKTVIRLLSVFKQQHVEEMESEDVEWITAVQKYLLEPEAKLRELVGQEAQGR